MKIETMLWWVNWRAQMLVGAFALVMALCGGLALDSAINAASAPGIVLLWPWYSTALVVVAAVFWTLSFVAAMVGVGERLTRPSEVTEDEADEDAGDDEPGGVST